METISEPEAMIEIWHTAPLLAYVDQDAYVEEDEDHRPEEEGSWPLDPAILHGLVYP